MTDYDFDDDDDFPDDMPTPCPACGKIVDFRFMMSARNDRGLIIKGELFCARCARYGVSTDE